jgi:hypothetical protein
LVTRPEEKLKLFELSGSKPEFVHGKQSETRMMHIFGGNEKEQGSQPIRIYTWINSGDNCNFIAVGFNPSTRGHYN